MEESKRALRLVQLGLTAIVLLVLGLIVFRDFVFGHQVLLYKNIGDDSTNYYYPYLLLFSRYLRTDGLPMWSFHVGMGQNIFSGIGDLLFQPSIWFPPSAIAQLLVYQHLFHVLVAGLLFYGCLTLRGVNFCASLLGALFFSFSAFMCMGSCWLILANEAICIAFVLFGVELRSAPRTLALPCLCRRALCFVERISRLPVRNPARRLCRWRDCTWLRRKQTNSRRARLFRFGLHRPAGSWSSCCRLA